jgi:hypothetical protein
MAAISFVATYDAWTMPAVKVDTWYKNEAAHKKMRVKHGAAPCAMCSFCLSRNCSDNPVYGSKSLKKTKRVLLRHTKTFDHAGTNPTFLHIRNGERKMED